MSETPNPKRKRRWLRRIVRIVFLSAIIIGLAAAVFLAALEAGWFDGWIRDVVVQRIEQVTGGKVELKSFHFAPYAMRVELRGLTAHGSEPEGTPPLFHADLVAAAIQVDSFWHKKISLKELRIV